MPAGPGRRAQSFFVGQCVSRLRTAAISVSPPSTTNDSPVTYDASSEARSAYPRDSSGNPGGVRATWIGLLAFGSGLLVLVAAGCGKSAQHSATKTGAVVTPSGRHLAKLSTSGTARGEQTVRIEVVATSTRPTRQTLALVPVYIGGQGPFLFALDMNSRLPRKTPLGLIRAFRAAFRPSEPVDLVIKVSPQEQVYPEWWRELRSAAAEAGVKLIDRSMSRT